MKTEIKEKKILRIIVVSLLIYFALLRFDVVMDFLKAAFKLFKPFIFGGAMAFVVNVPMRKIENLLRKMHLKKGVGVISFIITVLLISSLVGGFLFIIVPQIVETIFTIAEHLQAIYDSLPRISAESSSIWVTVEKYLSAFNINIEALMNNLIEALKNFSLDILSRSSAFVSGIISGFTTFFLSCIFSVYLLLGKEKNKKGLTDLTRALLPRHVADKIFHVANLTYRIFASFISGQCFEAIILGSMFVITMTVFGMPYAVLVGVTISVTALIPIFGAFIGCIFGVILIALESPMQAVWFIVLFIVLQQIEGDLIYPQVVGNSVGLPSVLVFMSVIIGGNLMGITGMLLFIPAVSVIYALIKEFVVAKKEAATKEIPLEEMPKIEENIN